MVGLLFDFFRTWIAVSGFAFIPMLWISNWIWDALGHPGYSFSFFFQCVIACGFLAALAVTLFAILEET